MRKRAASKRPPSIGLREGDADTPSTSTSTLTTTSPRPEVPIGAWDWFFSWPGLILLAVLTLALYSPAISGGFIWDDDDYVENNESLRTLDGLRRIWTDTKATPQYYPLVHTTFWIEYQLWGLKPLGFHVVNVLLHATSAWLFGRLLRMLEIPGALLGALLLAVHPVCVESVAWITERKNTLAMLAYLLGFTCYLQAVHGEAAGAAGFSSKGARYYGFFLLCFVAAMLSKTVAFSLPAAILVVLWWRDGRLAWQHALRMLPAIVVGLPLALTTARLERTQVGAMGPEFHQTFSERLLVAGRSIWFYAGKVVFPYPLAFSYERWCVDPNRISDWLYPISAIVFVLCLVLVAWIYRTRLGRAPLAAALLFGGTLFPAIGFFDVYPFRYSYVADHFQHLAILGPLALIAAVLVRSDFRTVSPYQSSWMRFACGLGIVAILSSLTFVQCQDYRDLETLWTRTLQKSPKAFIAWNNLGVLRFEQERIMEAIRCFENAAQHGHQFYNARSNLASAYLELNEPEKALEYALEAKRLYGEERPGVPMRPCEASVKADEVIALVDLSNGRVTQAKERFEKLAAFDVDIETSIASATVLGILCDAAGETSAAEVYRLRARELAAGIPARAWLIVETLDRFKRSEEATQLAVRMIESQLRDAREQIRPQEAALVLRLLIRSDRIEEASAQGERLAARGISSTGFLANRGVAYARLGAFDKAIVMFRTALAADPENAEVHANLAMALLQVGKPREALSELHLAEQAPHCDIAIRRLHAWVLAAHPDLSVVDSARALSLAEQLVRDTGNNDPTMLDALSVALASASRFAEAIETNQQAEEVARQVGDADLAAAISQRGLRFVKNQRFVDESLSPAK